MPIELKLPDVGEGIAEGEVVRNADAKSVIEPAREIVPREMMCLSLSFDHRIVDGGEATRFLNEVVRRIEASAI